MPLGPPRDETMRVLISPISLDEARVVIDGGCDILDIKNVKEGSLGAQPPHLLKEVVSALGGNRDILFSATLGDLPYKPGTAGLAALGAASCGVHYVKAGLQGATNRQQAFDMMDYVVKAIRLVSDEILAVASGYADFRRFGGVSYADVVGAARDAGADVVMVDTFMKDGRDLFDAMSVDELKDFVALAKEGGLLVALAGSVKTEHLETLAEVGPDIVGVRGAVCAKGDRTTGITRDAVEAFMAAAREISTGDEVDLFPRRLTPSS